jgi:hypothetical protein
MPAPANSLGKEETMIVEVKVLREFLCAHAAGPEVHLALDELVAHLKPPSPYIYKVGDRIWHQQWRRSGVVESAIGPGKTPSVIVLVESQLGVPTNERQEWSIDVCEPYSGQRP